MCIKTQSKYTIITMVIIMITLFLVYIYIYICQTGVCGLGFGKPSSEPAALWRGVSKPSGRPQLTLLLPHRLEPLVRATRQYNSAASSRQPHHSTVLQRIPSEKSRIIVTMLTLPSSARTKQPVQQPLSTKLSSNFVLAASADWIHGRHGRCTHVPWSINREFCSSFIATCRWLEVAAIVLEGLKGSWASRCKFCSKHLTMHDYSMVYPKTLRLPLSALPAMIQATHTSQEELKALTHNLTS